MFGFIAHAIHARSTCAVALVSLVPVGALLGGWFVPNDRYDVLTALLLLVVGVLGLMVRWIVQLQRECDRNTAHRLEAEQVALAFCHPEYDYDAGDWREATKPVAVRLVEPHASVGPLLPNSARASSL